MNAFDPLTTFNWINSAHAGAWVIGLALVAELIAARLCAHALNKRQASDSVSAAVASHPIVAWPSRLNVRPTSRGNV